MDIEYRGAPSTNFLMASLPCSHSSHPTTELNIHEDETDGASERDGEKSGAGTEDGGKEIGMERGHTYDDDV